MPARGSSREMAGARAATRVRKWARRKIIINAGYQFRTLLPILFYTGVFAVLVAGLVFFPLHREWNEEPDLGLRALLQQRLSELHWQLWPMLLLAAFLALGYALLRSHHVAGPFYRLRHVLQRMIEGDYRGVRFRRGDEFREFEAIVSQLGKKMQMLATRNRDVLMSVESRVKQLALRLDNEELPKAEVQTALDAILGQLAKARERTPVIR